MRRLTSFLEMTVIFCCGLQLGCASKQENQEISTQRMAQNVDKVEETDRNRPSYCTRCKDKKGDTVCVRYSNPLRSGGDSVASIDELVNDRMNCTPASCHAQGGQFGVFVSLVYLPALDDRLASSYSDKVFEEFKAKMKKVHEHLLKNKDLTKEDIEYSIQQQRESYDRIQGFLSGNKFDIDLHLRKIRESTLDMLFASKLNPEQQRLTREQTALRELSGVIAKHSNEATSLSASLQREVTSYATYRASEASRIEKLREISKTASATEDFAVLYDLIDDVRKNRNVERADNQALLTSIAEVYRVFFEKRSQFQKDLEPHLEILKAKAMPVPDLYSKEITSLTNMRVYAESRMQKIETASSKLLDGIRQRKLTLVVKKTNDETQQTLVSAATTQLSTNYLKFANQKIDSLWKNPPKSSVLDLEYQSDRYDRMIEFLQYEANCKAGGVAAVWMTEGCQFIRLQFFKIRQFINTSLPFALRMGVDTIRKKQLGIDEAILVAIELNVQNKKVGDAVRLFDEILRTIDRGAL